VSQSWWSAFRPAGQVIFVKTFAGLAEAGDDAGVGDTILEHTINLLADGFGQTGDFAGAPAMENEVDGIQRGRSHGK
jgi:hypothetical protein